MVTKRLQIVNHQLLLSTTGRDGMPPTLSRARTERPRKRLLKRASFTSRVSAERNAALRRNHLSGRAKQARPLGVDEWLRGLEKCTVIRGHELKEEMS
jgi:hypothetical protein